MLPEEDVIAAVCEYLSRQGYRIDQQCRTTRHGIDIIATQPASGVTIRIEAKGQTSNRPGSRRFGKGFNRGQSRIHVAAALYTAIATNDAHLPNDRVGIAFPSTTHHREFISRIRSSLRTLGIAVFWVDADRRVVVDP
jgi:Holliday junction resolvase-like predicted endonuclease